MRSLLLHVRLLQPSSYRGRLSFEPHGVRCQFIAACNEALDQRLRVLSMDCVLATIVSSGPNRRRSRNAA